MDIRRIVLASIVWVLALTSEAQVQGKVTDEASNPLKAMVFAEGTRYATDTDTKGNYSLKLPTGTHKLVAFVEGYESIVQTIHYTGGVMTAHFELSELSEELQGITVEASRSEDMGINWLNAVEGAAIYEAKKTELIAIDEIVGNLATNASRQVFARVPGLNIFENDGVGLQLAIGARGLDPNRTSNFNVRQNGYDISADALGYPESYYTPPSQALQRIEIVRGAAGLQYGPQFGGLLNFKFKEGPKDRKIALTSSNTIGSYGLFNTFTSLGGTVEKLNYYSFFQYKRSDGWRPNSSLDQRTAFGSIKYNFTPFFDVKLEFTHMDYTAHQPGGLTDSQFEEDPGQSNRARNWFQVGWNLGALQWNYRINPKLKINNRTFLLKSNRYAVGNLVLINRLDDEGQNRNLLKDDYDNWGNELRVVYHYNLLGQKSILLVGNRYYHGETASGQGAGTNERDANFSYLNPAMPANSLFQFRNSNVSFFVENIFNITSRFSITPGIRYEYISTKADGYYIDRKFDFAGNVLSEKSLDESRIDQRDFALLGIGASYKMGANKEVYANFSQNYRGINFTDIRVDNPSLQVDSLITDESGFNIDIGVRGSKKEAYQFDISAFYLSYQDRIGNALVTVPDPKFNNLIQREITFRTNIGSAFITGIESYGELAIAPLIGWSEKRHTLKAFVNFAFIYSQYKDIGKSVQEGVKSGNEVELVPNFNIKTGITYGKSGFKASVLYSIVGEQFSDAANTTSVVPAATQGKVPAYSVLDASFSYVYKRWKIDTGVTNLLDQRYFTRRATGYPGPGIIPSEPRSFYVTLQVKID